MPFLRVIRDKRGYETTYLMHIYRDGVALEARLGYRLRLGPTWAIVPFARYLRSVTVTSSYGAQRPGEEIAPSMLSFGASILWH